MELRRLDAATENVIVATQAIHGPSEVVYQLFLNAYRANASKIDILLTEKCDSIVVTDNGNGISWLNPGPWQKYRGSECFVDTERTFLKKLGWISCITIESENCKTRQHLTIRGGKISSCTQAYKRGYTGTRIKVSELFFPVPVRRDSLATPTNRRLVNRMCEALVLGYPNLQIGVTLVGSSLGRSVFPVTPSFKQRFYQFRGNEDNTKLEEISGRIKNLVKVQGLISSPTIVTSAYKRCQHIFINDLPLPPSHSLGEFTNKLLMNYRRRLVTIEKPEIRVHTKKLNTQTNCSGGAPIFVVKVSHSFTQFDPDNNDCKQLLVDAVHRAVVKLHPAIATFQKSDFLVEKRRFERRGGEDFGKSSKKRRFGLRSTNDLTTRPLSANKSASQPSSESAPRVSFSTQLPSLYPAHRKKVDDVCRKMESTGFQYAVDVRAWEENQRSPKKLNQLLAEYQNAQSSLYPRMVNSVIDVRRKRLTPVALEKKMLDSLHIISQWDNKFILAKTSDILVIVDQHAADERVRFESSLADVMTRGTTSRILSSHVLPKEEILALSQEDIVTVSRYRVAIERWGFGFEGNVPHASTSLTHVPTVFSVPLTAIDFKDYLAALESPSFSSSSPPPGVRRLLVSKACRGAVMFGTALKHNRIRSLLRKLKGCEFPFLCAHGRPSMMPLITFQFGLRNNSGSTSAIYN
ncbi:hypothetical protein AAMO2058_000273200 [Amorphochlora amoebiformis]